MSDKFRLHLYGPGHSGRSIRYALLSVEQVEHCEKLALRSLGENKEATLLELNAAIAREGVELMLREISTPHAPDKLADAKWDKVTAEQVHERKLTGLGFTVKDIAALKKAYEREHIVSREDVDRIFEGKVPEVD